MSYYILFIDYAGWSIPGGPSASVNSALIGTYALSTPDIVCVVQMALYSSDGTMTGQAESLGNDMINKLGSMYGGTWAIIPWTDPDSGQSADCGTAIFYNTQTISKRWRNTTSGYTTTYADFPGLIGLDACTFLALDFSKSGVDVDSSHRTLAISMLWPFANSTQTSVQQLIDLQTNLWQGLNGTNQPPSTSSGTGSFDIGCFVGPSAFVSSLQVTPNAVENNILIGDGAFQVSVGQTLLPQQQQQLFVLTKSTTTNVEPLTIATTSPVTNTGDAAMYMVIVSAI